MSQSRMSAFLRTHRVSDPIEIIVHIEVPIPPQAQDPSLDRWARHDALKAHYDIQKKPLLDVVAATAGAKLIEAMAGTPDMCVVAPKAVWLDLQEALRRAVPHHVSFFVNEPTFFPAD